MLKGGLLTLVRDGDRGNSTVVQVDGGTCTEVRVAKGTFTEVRVNRGIFTVALVDSGMFKLTEVRDDRETENQLQLIVETFNRGG
jgi:hypothetical protein